MAIDTGTSQKIMTSGFGWRVPATNTSAGARCANSHAPEADTFGWGRREAFEHLSESTGGSCPGPGSKIALWGGEDRQALEVALSARVPAVIDNRCAERQVRSASRSSVRSTSTCCWWPSARGARETIRGAIEASCPTWREGRDWWCLA